MHNIYKSPPSTTMLLSKFLLAYPHNLDISPEQPMCSKETSSCLDFLPKMMVRKILSHGIHLSAIKTLYLLMVTLRITQQVITMMDLYLVAKKASESTALGERGF